MMIDEPTRVRRDFTISLTANLAFAAIAIVLIYGRRRRWW